LEISSLSEAIWRFRNPKRPMREFKCVKEGNESPASLIRKEEPGSGVVTPKEDYRNRALMSIPLRSIRLLFWEQSSLLGFPSI